MGRFPDSPWFELAATAIFLSILSLIVFLDSRTWFARRLYGRVYSYMGEQPPSKHNDRDNGVAS